MELLKKGIIWRIGNGRSVRIWRDPWIPRDHSRRPITKKSNCRTKWVADLLTDAGEWDVDRVRQIFWPIDAEVILKIRVPSQDVSDFVAWHPDRLGRFSVRSAYSLAVSLASENACSASSAVDRSKAWNMLWKCNVPQKVKIFAWKVALDCLATMVNKKRRKLEATDVCAICGTEEEDIAHALYRCPHAKSLWMVMKESQNISCIMDDGPFVSGWIFDRLEHLLEPERAMFLMVLWRNWFVRNDITHGKPAPTTESSRRFLESYMCSLLEIKQQTPSKFNERKTCCGLCSDGRHQEFPDVEQCQAQVGETSFGLGETEY